MNVEENINRNDIYESYTHISFSIDEKDYEPILEKLKHLNVDIKEGRSRFQEEGKSIYFRDPDGHLFQFHSKTREDRIEFYKKNRPNLTFFI